MHDFGTSKWETLTKDIGCVVTFKNYKTWRIEICVVIIFLTRGRSLHLTMAVLQFFLLTLFVVSTRSSDMFSNMLTLDEGNYNVSWTFNATSDTLEFLVQVRAVGWVGFGVAEPPATGMEDYDVAIGGVMSNGTSYFGVSWSQNIIREIF